MKRFYQSLNLVKPFFILVSSFFFTVIVIVRPRLSHLTSSLSSPNEQSLQASYHSSTSSCSVEAHEMCYSSVKSDEHTKNVRAEKFFHVAQLSLISVDTLASFTHKQLKNIFLPLQPPTDFNSRLMCACQKRFEIFKIELKARWS